jgi:hypothetical protein
MWHIQAGTGKRAMPGFSSLETELPHCGSCAKSNQEPEAEPVTGY